MLLGFLGLENPMMVYIMGAQNWNQAPAGNSIYELWSTLFLSPWDVHVPGYV
jgi:hypothetical protein